MASARLEIQRATTSTTHILPKVTEQRATMIANRRHLHQHPELSYQEVNTVKYLKEQIEQI